MIYVFAAIGLAALFVIPALIVEHRPRDNVDKFLNRVRKDGRKRK